MAKLLLGVVVAALAFAGIHAEDSIDLTDSDFDSTLATFDTALVMFYAPW